MKNIEVLGTGCANCRATQKLNETAAEEQGVEIRLGKAGQIQDIIAYGIMSMAGVVVEGVAHAGGMPGRDNLAGWLFNDVGMKWTVPNQKLFMRA
jgi:hypothetical protein